jgi:hypothetical protein
MTGATPLPRTYSLMPDNVLSSATEKSGQGGSAFAASPHPAGRAAPAAGPRRPVTEETRRWPPMIANVSVAA